MELSCKGLSPSPWEKQCHLRYSKILKEWLHTEPRDGGSPISHWSPAPVTSQGPRLIGGGDPSPSTPLRPAGVPRGLERPRPAGRRARGRGHGGGRGSPRAAGSGYSFSAFCRKRWALSRLPALRASRAICTHFSASSRLPSMARASSVSAAAQLRGGPAAEEARRPGGRGAARRGEERAPRRRRRRPGDGRPRSSASSRPPPRPPRPQRRQPRPSRVCRTPGPGGRSRPERVARALERTALNPRRGPGARLPRHRGGDRGPALSVRFPRTRGPAPGHIGLARPQAW